MDLNSILLSVVIGLLLIIAVMIYILLKKLIKNHDRGVKEIVDLITDNQSTLKGIIESKISATNGKISNLDKKLFDQISSDLIKGLDEIQLKKQKKRNDEISAILEKSNEFEGLEKINFLEYSLQRFPGTKSIFQKLYELYSGVASEDILLVDRRNILLELDKIVQQFLQYCSLEDSKFAISKKNDVDQMFDKLDVEIKHQEKKIIEKQIKQLKEEVNQVITNKKENEEDTKKLAGLDDQINRNALKKYPALEKEYKELSDKIITHFQNMDTENRSNFNLRYNKRALKYINIAWHKFNEDKKKFNDKKEKTYLDKLIRILGGSGLKPIILPNFDLFLHCLWRNISSLESGKQVVFHKTNANRTT